MNTLEILTPVQLFQSNKVFNSVELDNVFQKKIRVLVLYETATDLNEADKELAIKILGAVKVSTQDFLLLNVFQKSFSVHLAKHYFEPEIIMVFSDSKYTLGKNISLPLFEIFELEGIKILRSTTFSNLEKQKSQKEILWARMQTLFNI